jgi:hypothetical protein
MQDAAGGGLRRVAEPDIQLDRLAAARAYEERVGSVYHAKGSFLFTPLRSHPRFRALLGKSLGGDLGGQPVP